MVDFMRYRGDWKLWRALGSRDTEGNWHAPISYLEAQKLPKAMLDIFFILDDYFERMRNKRAKMKAG